MHNSKHIFQQLASRITIDEDKSEKESIAMMLLEDVYGVTRTEILSEKAIAISDAQHDRLSRMLERVNAYEPIQHVLGYAYFAGLKFSVSKDVLIPRPETEELVRIGLKFLSTRKNPKILDIGTGSGCIPIAIATERPDAEVFATDVSENALDVAQLNSRLLNARVQFLKHDILEDALPFDRLDLVFSNPPYIARHENTTMQKQVTEFEPHLALFAPDDDPLIFYKAISAKAYHSLLDGGMLAVEINERLGHETAEVLNHANFKNVQIMKDLSGKDRFVTGIR